MELLIKRLSSNVFRPLISCRHRSNSTHFKRPQDHVILRANLCDFDEILALMKTSFYPFEPSTKSLAYRPNNAMNEYTIQSLSEGYSVVAKCKYNGVILAAGINETSSPWDPAQKDKLACHVDCEKTRQILHFYAHTQRIPNLWQKYCVPKIFEAAYVVVRKDQRGKGLAFQILKASRSIAADCGYQVFRVDASNVLTAHLCEKMKMKMVAEIPFCTYVGENQLPIFQPEPPNTSVKVYVDDQPQTNAKLQNDQMTF